MTDPSTFRDLERRLAKAEAEVAELRASRATAIATALRESEELRRIAHDGGGMGAWRWDLQRRLVWGDVKFPAFWGLQPAVRHFLQQYIN